MKLDKSVKLQEKTFLKALEIRMKKGHDYAKPDADCLSNFKVMADVADALERNGYRIPIEKPHGVAAWHMLHKFIRLLNFWNEETEPECEGLEDTHLDLTNYNHLSEHCYMDYIEAKKSKEKCES